MSHQLSLACYQNASRDAAVPPKQYEDLKSLIGLFGLTDSDRDSAQGAPMPDRFEFMSQAPTLLIVEDETGLADMLRVSLVRKGYPEEAVLVFPSGEEAIFYARNHAVGIGLLDIKLSNPLSIRDVYTSGMQVLRTIKETSPGAKVILVSGFGTYEMVREAILELGASYYLGKPLMLSDILRIVHWAVGQLLGPGVEQAVSAGAPVDAGPAPLGGGSESVLVVDDDLAVAESIALTLRTFGYNAAFAGGGKEALRRLTESRFDAIVLDIKMPGVDGLEVLRRIRRMGISPVVLILTGVADERIAKETVELGAYDFLTKPYDIHLLQLSLEYALAQR